MVSLEDGSVACFIRQSVKYYLRVFKFHRYTISAYTDIVKILNIAIYFIKLFLGILK